MCSALQSGHSRGIGLGKEEEEQLRTFIVNMVSEPLVLVIKLADRLHNMRTVFALKKDKQKAVATETLQVWCSLAERLGMMVVKVLAQSNNPLPPLPLNSHPTPASSPPLLPFPRASRGARSCSRASSGCSGQGSHGKEFGRQ